MRQTILIVDDSMLNIFMLTELLHSDYNILTATSGKDALSIAFSDGDPPDLILLDVVMPHMDGYEVCKRLKQNHKTKSIPIIFITGMVNEESEIKAFSEGAVDYITKPFSQIVVQARVNTHAELKRHRDFLESMSYLDGLTGIPNRRRFDEHLTMMWNCNQRAGLPISIVMMDLDFFKRYNDHYGHQAGDDCLCLVANALNSALARKTDLVARYGGEEFVCILSNASREGTWYVAEKLRNSILDLKIPHETSPVSDYVTISIGMANAVPDRNAQACELVKSADQALYQAKKAGRNQIKADWV